MKNRKPACDMANAQIIFVEDALPITDWLETSVGAWLREKFGQEYKVEIIRPQPSAIGKNPAPVS